MSESKYIGCYVPKLHKDIPLIIGDFTFTRKKSTVQVVKKAGNKKVGNRTIKINGSVECYAIKLEKDWPVLIDNLKPKKALSWEENSVELELWKLGFVRSDESHSGGMRVEVAKGKDMNQELAKLILNSNILPPMSKLILIHKGNISVALYQAYSSNKMMPLLYAIDKESGADFAAINEELVEALSKNYE